MYFAVTVQQGNLQKPFTYPLYLPKAWLSSYFFKSDLASWRNTNSLACVGSKCDLSLAMVKPAEEKTFSEGAEVAGIANNLMVILASKGNCCRLTSHQSKGLLYTHSSLCSSNAGSLLYRCSSASALSNAESLFTLSASLLLLLLELTIR
jgi:hypothetical protein